MTLFLPEKTQRLVNIAKFAKGTRETARLALDCFDLTSLKGDETKEEIFELCDIAKHNKLKSVFVYPNHIDSAIMAIRNAPVVIGTPINFPSGQFRTLKNEPATAQTIKADVEEGLSKGARQFDIVFPLHLLNEGRVPEIKEFLTACRNAVGKDATMKVILETAAFESAEKLRRACHISIYCGTDCLKTSTGKHSAGGATLEAAAILMEEAHRAPHMVGCKISGGIRTNDDCAKYITLARGIRGHNTITPELFRIGASSLINDLILSLGNAVQPPRTEGPAYVY